MKNSLCQNVCIYCWCNEVYLYMIELASFSLFFFIHTKDGELLTTCTFIFHREACVRSIKKQVLFAVIQDNNNLLACFKTTFSIINVLYTLHYDTTTLILSTKCYQEKYTNYTL
jgi:hypothetical protein